MSLAVGIQVPTCFRDGSVQTDGCHCILQHPALTHVHMNIAAGHERQAELTTQNFECGQVLFVRTVQEQLDGNADVGSETVPQPARLFRARRFRRYPQDETLLQSRSLYIFPAQTIAAFRSRASSTADQPAKPAIAVAINRDRHELQAALEAELGADEQFQPQQLGGHVRPYHSGNGTLIRDGQCAVAQSTGTIDELLWMRSTAQERKVADAMQLSVAGGRAAGCSSCFRTVASHRRTPGAHPNTPCRNHRCGSVRSRKIHNCTPCTSNAV